MSTTLSRAITAPLDGSTITLRELCLLLADDDEPFPRHYDNALIRLFSRERLARFLKPLSYGELATTLGRRLTYY